MRTGSPHQPSTSLLPLAKLWLAPVKKSISPGLHSIETGPFGAAADSAADSEAEATSISQPDDEWDRPDRSVSADLEEEEERDEKDEPEEDESASSPPISSSEPSAQNDTRHGR